jgi:S-formylglutathione hydrolase
MTFSVFVPPQAEAGPVPILYFLSGLSCTADNFTTKAGAQRLAAAAGVLVVAPDTSPRGAGVPGENDSDDLGTGAGFYVNATKEPWARNYRMYDYVVDELPALVKQNFAVQAERESICGHSMGGHGALICALRNPRRYRSVSAFAPICAPSQVPWGQKAFAAYLGPDRAAWAQYDATALIKHADPAQLPPILIDQGDRDPFLATQLHPDELRQAAADRHIPITYRLQSGYDHSYYFIATFLADHIEFHRQALREGPPASR